jgi:hypothetical protein
MYVLPDAVSDQCCWDGKQRVAGPCRPGDTVVPCVPAIAGFGELTSTQKGWLAAGVAVVGALIYWNYYR